MMVCRFEGGPWNDETRTWAGLPPVAVEAAGWEGRYEWREHRDNLVTYRWVSAEDRARPVESPPDTTKPVGLQRLCDFCGTNPPDPMYREVQGFERLRRGGGANQIVGRRVTERRICRVCIGKVRAGIPIEQKAML